MIYEFLSNIMNSKSQFILALNTIRIGLMFGGKNTCIQGTMIFLCIIFQEIIQMKQKFFANNLENNIIALPPFGKS